MFELKFEAFLASSTVNCYETVWTEEKRSWLFWLLCCWIDWTWRIWRNWEYLAAHKGPRGIELIWLLLLLLLRCRSGSRSNRQLSNAGSSGSLRFPLVPLVPSGSLNSPLVVWLFIMNINSWAILPGESRVSCDRFRDSRCYDPARVHLHRHWRHYTILPPPLPPLSYPPSTAEECSRNEQP